MQQNQSQRRNRPTVFLIPGEPYECNLCYRKFALRYYVERHFIGSCFRKHSLTHPKAKW